MKALAIAGMTACLASVPAFAVCIEPQASIHVPDGAVATREEMLFARSAVGAYDAAVKEYAECVQKGDGTAIRAAPALEKLAAIADKMNTELRAFRKRTGS